MDRLVARVARRFIAGRVPLTIDTGETLAARKRFPLFTTMVVGTFDGSFALYRAFDGPELKRILRTGKITGGKYSAPAERAYGASWGHNITEVIRGLNSERGRRIGADLYLAKIDGLDQRFAHLNPEVEFDLAGPAFQKASLDASVCNVGLGCSVFVEVHDVDAFYLVRPDHQIEPLKPAELKARVEHIELEEDEPVKKTPEKVRGTYAVKPRDKFKVANGSTKLGINANNSGRVVVTSLPRRSRSPAFSSRPSPSGASCRPRLRWSSLPSWRCCPCWPRRSVGSRASSTWCRRSS